MPAMGGGRSLMNLRAGSVTIQSIAFKYMMASELHCKKNWSENKSLFRIPIPPTVFSISVVQNLSSSPLSFLKIIEVGKRTWTPLMETNSISLSKEYFRCIGLNKVGTFLSVSRFFSIGWNCSICE
jgi:hypothetical protein